ncbi:hypothetical protein B0O99DRAFT_281312 [Bisporella sp. PMI_857]|nr:hypothetical protein B0O99DRAFT_281312 [Bisporella sp. PMI_857]
MQLPTTLFLTALFSTTVLAGYNCKCQDSRGQYNDLTEAVCKALAGEKAQEIGGSIPLLGGILGGIVSDARYRGDKNHQCSSGSGQIDSGKFVKACASLGVGTEPYGGAFCWK